ncbi:MAG: protease pro-enzyme activation domain-containing protein [Kiritimatiellaeota bacterium]|nr:protease pro-enzyme activation domain-containing protein [Kiritimatiellota bacterium]
MKEPAYRAGLWRGSLGVSWIALWLTGMCAASAATPRRVLPGHVPAAVARLAPSGRLAGATELRLAIGLPLRNPDGLARLLQQLYDPTSPNYRSFLTPAQFAERFGPTEQDYQALTAFVQGQGLKVTGVHANRAVLDVGGKAADIERAFQVTLRTYAHPTEKRVFHAPEVEPSVDAAVAILHVSGLDDYALPRPLSRLKPAQQTAQATPHSGSGPGGAYRGNDFRTAYVPGTTLTGAGQSIGLVQFDAYYSNDIAAYISQAGITTSVTLTNIPVNGGVATPGANNAEVALDIEMVISMAPGLAKVIVYEAPNGSTPWPTILSRIANDNLARQLSCSWGGGGPNPTAEQIFQQMAAQGQSFFNASGDSDAFTAAIPFPSDSTNITEVGGTTLTTTGPGGSYASETVWNWGGGTGSSGGISTYYAIPTWQQGLGTNANQGSATMRNVPDVALTADNVYVVYNNGASNTFGGTSCAAPLWAGFAALINQQTAARGQPPVGFLNPALYALGTGGSYTACFHDTKTGNNFSSSSPAKFAAVTGYDLCTGWGTPTGTNLINAFLTASAVTDVSPSSGPLSGGTTVTISGSNLGQGDVTNVTLCGLPATIVTDQSPTQIVVGAGAAAVPTNGDVAVYSSSAGVGLKTNGYTYLPPAPPVLAATNVAVSGFFANWAAVPGATHYLLDVSATLDFANLLAGYANLGVGPVTTYRVYGLSADTPCYYRLRAQQNGIASEPSATMAVRTASANLTATNGPAAGGNIITIAGPGLGNGWDISDVTLCGIAAAIQSQTADTVTVRVGAGGLGAGDIVIRSGSLGVTTIVNGYTYNAAGAIYGAFSGWAGASNLPAARAYLAAAVVNGKIYAIGGQSSANSYQSTAYVYDPLQPAAGWLSISNLPAANGYLAAASAHGKLYALGGYNGSYQSAVYEYDPLQPAAGWHSVSSLPAARQGLAAASVNGQLYAIGGYNGSYQATVYQGSFASGVAPMVGPLTGGTTVTISGSNLGQGDVTNVTLCGIPAAIVTDQSPTQIVVRTGVAAVPAAGDVVVSSPAYGVTTGTKAFAYAGGWIMASAGAHGSVTPAGAIFVPAGASTNFLIAADQDYAIAEILTNGQAFAFGNPTNVTVVWNNVTASGTLTADFAALLATNGVPQWWLRQYYPASNDFNAVALADTDGTGLANWQKYLAGLDPTNRNSNLLVQSLAAQPGAAGFTITWPAVPGKTYQVEYCEALTGPWHSDLPGSQLTAGQDQTALSYTDRTGLSANQRYYRIMLVLP